MSTKRNIKISIYNILASLLFITLCYVPTPAQLESCSDWSSWSDISKVQNDFIIAYGELSPLPDDTDDPHQCRILHLDPVPGPGKSRERSRISVAVAGGMVCTVGLTASVIATYFYTRPRTPNELL